VSPPSTHTARWAGHQRPDRSSATPAEATLATLTEIAARIRFTVDGGVERPVVVVTCDSPENLVLPAVAGRAIFEAAWEAVKNAVRHSGARRCEVRLVGNRSAGQARVSVSVKDNGTGFDPALDSDRRLGIRGCIVGRMLAADGFAAIDSGHRQAESSSTSGTPPQARD